MLQRFIGVAIIGSPMIPGDPAMPISPGTRLGSYEVLGPLGAGGMGEVYRAHDTRLRRDVAIKALPADLAGDPERLTRLEREARLLAALNHPNIAAIYGLEEAGGAPYLVMECVEGETLAQKLARGPLPVDDALAVATQIAAALEAAHGAGVIHRDLKPANVMVRRDGSVKVLDLGLARAVADSPAGDPSLSPTITSGGTQDGVILGTAAYMSPEQARGKALDKRTDVFSFGCVLYESLTGKRAFPGDTISDTLAAVLRGEPEWSALPADTPPAVRRVLRRCLQKDVRKRLHDVGDARIELEDDVSEPATVIAAPRPRGNRLLWALGGALLGIVAVYSAGRLFGRPTPPAARPVRAVLPLPPETRLSFARRPAIAVSPDGRTVVFRATSQDVPRLYRRDLDGSSAQPIAGTEGGFSPFFSPTGEWLGFFTPTELKKVPLAGGSPIRISPMPPVTAGASWGEDGKIVLTMTANGALSTISESGGRFEPLSTLDASRRERSHLWPQILPKGRGILVTMVVGRDFQDFDDSQIVVLDPKTGRRTVVLEGTSFARYAAGQLVFIRGASLFRVPFDLDRLAIRGSPVSAGERVAIMSDTRTASFAVTPDGALVYVEGPPTPEDRSVVLRIDRSGGEKPLPLPESFYIDPRLSPDGRTLALQKCVVAVCKIFLYDMERNVLTPLTSETGRAFNPVWSPDGRRIAYSGFSIGAPTLFVRNADGSGQPRRLTTDPTEQRQVAEFPDSWSPDGGTIVYVRVSQLVSGAAQRDVWIVSPDGKGGRPWNETPYIESVAALSPDGRLMAYVSDESGRNEVYVRPFSGGGGRVKISSEGGNEPVWTRGGAELLFRQGNRFLSVEVRTQPELAAGIPRELFSGEFIAGGREDAPFSYTVSADGSAIYATRAVAPPDPERTLAIVTNWIPSPAK